MVEGDIFVCLVKQMLHCLLLRWNSLTSAGSSYCVFLCIEVMLTMRRKMIV